MEFLSEYGLFLLKVVTLVAGILVVVGAIFGMSRKARPKLEITPLNKELDHIKRQMLSDIKDRKTSRKKIREEKKSAKDKPSMYLIEFHGDIKASQAESLRDEVSAVLSAYEPNDHVVVKIDSPGGAVNSYGLAASQLQRLRDRGIPLTACIDKVAASGGYLMACVANHIVAAPFAIIGSIGVVAQIPNFYRWLKKHNIDVELLTAGEYKRTLTIFAENNDKGRKKFQEDLEKIHQAFRDYVMVNRHQLDISDLDKIATGEHWLAKDAFDLKLVDTLKTSDDWLMEKMGDFNIFKITMHSKQSLTTKLLKPAAALLHPWA